MSTAWKQTSAPGAAILSIADAKTHLRVTHSDDDGYIDNLVSAATTYIETVTGKQLINATYTYKLSGFPYDRELVLPVAPLQSVSSVQYEDSNGSTQTLSSSNYDVDADSEEPRIVLVPTEYWPTTEANRHHAVTVTFIAGYGSAASDIPEDAVHACRLLVTHWYENREAVVDGRKPETLPFGVDPLLDGLKSGSLF